MSGTLRRICTLNLRVSSCLLCLLAITILGGPSTIAQQSPATLLPVDEAVSRPDFFTFRSQLQTVIARHDALALVDFLDPKMKNNFGGDDGIEAFQRIWQVAETDSKLWSELGTVLALGGSFTGKDEFTAPYTFSRWPKDLDAFDYVAVIGSNVRVRAQPDLDSSTIATVNFAVLPLDAESTAKDWRDQAWAAVKVAGKKGYIATRFVRSSIDYRAQFTYSGGRWRLTFFLAGD
jgi:hypothetical protein